MLSRRRLLRHALSVPVAAALAKLPVAQAKEAPSAQLDQAVGLNPGERWEIQLHATPTSSYGRYDWGCVTPGSISSSCFEWYERDYYPVQLAQARHIEDEFERLPGPVVPQLVVSKETYRWLKDNGYA